MMDSGTISCFPNIASHNHFDDQMFSEDLHSSLSFSMDGGPTTGSASDAEMQSSSLFYNLSVLKEKSHQVQSLVTVLISPEPHHHQQQQQLDSTSLAIANMGSLVEDIIGAASSIMLTCNSLSSASTSPDNNALHSGQQQQPVSLPDDSQYNFDIIDSQGLNFASQTIDWYGDHHNQNFNPRVNRDSNSTILHISHHKVPKKADRRQGVNPFVNSYKDYDLIEIDAADLLAKFTHYCEICGKGFKRDANLRMHMRAHGDLYKNGSSVLTNPLKKSGNNDKEDCSMELRTKKYSCPHEGCRWNRKHHKFQPLKSMICVKNHYKRSHCPKMYMCKRCNMKQFSVLSDLRTHEKHCGDQKWQCSCGTTFSRKDKLMGHVALFVGHTPLIAMANSSGKMELHQASYY